MTDRTNRIDLAQAVLLDDPAFLRDLVARAVQALLDEEMTAHLGADRYERTGERRGYRNGTKPRTLTTRVGTIDLLVPQDRDGTFSTELFSRYQRSEQALVASLMEMYVHGVATRKVAQITETLCGTRFSKSQVSALASRLDTELSAWRERPLTAPSYPYVWVDARYEHVRVDGRVISQGVLLVSGVRGDNGRREMLGVTVADTESEATKTSDGVHLTFFCRYCRTNHWHGAGDDGQAWGHRVSHCHDDRSAYRGPGYVLVPAPGTMDEAERQTIIDSLRTWAERFGKRLVNERSS